jgi:hypothetical protein
MDKKNFDLLNEFTDALVEILKPEKTFLVSTPENVGAGHSLPDIFSKFSFSTKKNFMELNFNEGKFDLILGMIPIGLKGKELGETKFESTELSWELIFKLSETLTDFGYGIFLMGPLGFGGSRGDAFLKRMNKQGIFVHSYINLPKNILRPTISIRPILVIMTKQTAKLRICSLDFETDPGKLIKDLFKENCDSNFIDTLEHKKFNGFQSFQVSKQIQRLESRYKDFKTLKFKDFVKNFSHGKQNKSFEDLPNSVYLKILGNNSNLITSRSAVSGRIENFLQIQLTESVSNQYLKIFFRSTLGELIIQSTINSSLLPRLNKEFLFEIEIPVPDISVQNQVVETMLRMDRLEKQLEQFKNQISLNPLSHHILSKIDSMLEISNELSAEDKIKSSVLQGESELVEFKQTFQHCLRNDKKETYIETSALKTVVAFLNSKGGTLLVGVEDSGFIPGIDFEIRKYHRNSRDKFLLHLKDKIKSRIGVSVFNFIEIRLVNVEGNQVLLVACLPSDREVFLDDRDFYVRTSPATEKLEGRSFSNYVRNRFKI